MGSAARSKNSKKHTDGSANATRTIVPINHITKGSFGVIYSCKSIGIQKCSFLQVVTDDLGWNQPIIGTGVMHDIKENMFFYLHVKFEGGSLKSAEIKLSSSWWSEYPMTRKWNLGNTGLKKPSNQTDYFLPVAYCGSQDTGRGVSIFPCNGSTKKNLFIERYIRGDLALYFSCDGFLILPSPANVPCA